MELSGRLMMPTPLRAVKQQKGDHVLSPRSAQETSTIIDLTQAMVGKNAIIGFADYLAKNTNMDTPLEVKSLP